MILGYLYQLIFWCSTGLIAAVGGINGDIKVLFYLSIIDCATGFLKAVKEKNVLSKNMFIGFIIRKPAIYLAIATMYQLDQASFIQGMGVSLRGCMVTGCIFMETVSIVENLTKLGIKMPKTIENILAIKQNKFSK